MVSYQTGANLPKYTPSSPLGGGIRKNGKLKMKFKFFAATLFASAAAVSANAQVNPLTTVNLDAQVAEICAAYNSGIGASGTISIDFGELSNTDATAQIAAPGFNITYICNVQAGFTRSISSENNGFLFRAGSSGGANNQVPYTLQHGGGSGLGFSETQLTTAKTNTFNGSSAFMAGQGGTATFRVSGVRIPSPANAALFTTNAFAGDYSDVVTISVIAN